MALVDELAKLRAAAQGGPSAAREYEQQQAATQDLRQQALTEASANADSLRAPEQFKLRQAEQIAAPLDAQIQALGTLGRGAGQFEQSYADSANKYLQGQAQAGDQYLGAAQTAANQQLGAVQAANQSNVTGIENLAPLVQQQAQQQEEDAYRQQLIELAGVKRTAAARAAQQRELDTAAALKPAQLAATKGELGQDTYDTLLDTIKESDGDPEIADAIVENYRKQVDAEGHLLDQEGNVVYVDQDGKELDPKAEYEDSNGDTVSAAEIGQPITLDIAALDNYVQDATGRPRREVPLKSKAQEDAERAAAEAAANPQPAAPGKKGKSVLKDAGKPYDATIGKLVSGLLKLYQPQTKDNS